MMLFSTGWFTSAKSEGRTSTISTHLPQGSKEKVRLGCGRARKNRTFHGTLLFPLEGTVERLPEGEDTVDWAEKHARLGKRKKPRGGFRAD